MKHLLTLRAEEIETACNGNDSRRFLAICRTSIQEQLALLWETESAAITLADLHRRLAEDSPLIVIFSAAEESAYSGQELNNEQMQEFSKSLQKELEGLI